MSGSADPSSPYAPRHRRSERNPRHRPRFTGEVATPYHPVTFDGVTEIILYLLLAFSPMAFGVVHAWSREIFLLLVAAAAVVVATKHAVRAYLGQPCAYRWSWAYPVMLAFLGLTAAQLLALPADWVHAISPATIRLKSEALFDLPNLGDLLRRVTISFYPNATVDQLALTLAICALFAIVLDVYREPTRIRRMLTVMVIMGLLVGARAAFQNLTGNPPLYAGAALGHPNSGPFMVYSHFSQFMNLSMGAALALLLDRLADLAHFYRTPGEVWMALRQPRNAIVWVCAALCLAAPVLIMLSLARVGIVSVGVGAIVTVALLAWRGKASGAGAWRAWLIVGFGLAVFAVLLAVGFDRVSKRLSTLSDVEHNGGGRTTMLRDMVAEFRLFPLVGTGLGTHEMVYGQFDHRNLPSIATHAENEYFQLMEETGAVGVALAALFLIGLGVSYARVVWLPAEPIDYVPFGLGFGLVAILFHSWSDFGQHLPALASLTAIDIALITSLARRKSLPDPSPVALPQRRVLPIFGCTLLALVVMTAGAAIGVRADRQRQADALYKSAREQEKTLIAHDWEGTDEQFETLTSTAGAAVELQPDNVEYRYWRDYFQHQAIPEILDPKTSAWIIRPDCLARSQRVLDDLNTARSLCPTYPRIPAMAGVINRDTFGRTALGSQQIRLGYRLSPYNFSTALIAGEDALLGQRWDEAATIYERYMTLQGMLKSFAPACVKAGHPEIPFEIAKRRGDWQGIQYVASLIPAGDARLTGRADEYRAEATRLLSLAAAEPDATPGTLSAMADEDVRQGRSTEGVALYRRSLNGAYGNVDIRMRLAHTLLAMGHPAEASKEAKTVLGLQPQRADARALVEECRQRAATLPGNT